MVEVEIIIGCVIGGLALLILMFAACFCFCCRARVASQCQGSAKVEESPLLRQQVDTACIATTAAEEDHFKRVALLGCGRFGDVSLVQHKISGQYYALKSMDKKLLIAEQGNEAYADMVRDFSFRDVEIMRRLNHPNVLTPRETFQSETNIFYLMDFMQGGDLMKFVEGCAEERLPLEATRFWAAELYLALRYLHSEGVLYGYLKPTILLSAKGHAILAGFEFPDTSLNHWECVAPEVQLDSRNGSVSTDWWNFGVLIYRWLYGRKPFNGVDRMQLFQNIVNHPLRFPRDIDFGEADAR